MRKKFLCLTSKAVLLMIILSCALRAAFAGEDFPDEAEMTTQTERWYLVEVLIYKQRSSYSKIEEIWPKDIILDYPETWVILKSSDEFITDPTPHPVLQQWLDHIESSTMTPFVTQEDKDKSLLELGKDKKWFPGKILFHEAWWQPFIKNDERDPIGILIKAGRKYDEHHELEGSISLKLSRYLHIHTNLWLTSFEKNADKAESNLDWIFGFNDPEQEMPWPVLPASPDSIPAETLIEDNERSTADAGIKMERAPLEYTAENPPPPPEYKTSNIVTVRQSRRMRSNEVHYIDHPKLGILVRLTPYEDTEHAKNAATSSGNSDSTE